MILAPEFVFIHQPKTGGTFVSQVLSRLLGASMTDVNKHGVCNDIPSSHRGLPIVATARDPYDRYVSQYEFGWFRRAAPPEWFDMNAVRAKYPCWPDTTFAEFVDAAIDGFRRLKTSPLAPEDQPGFHSEQFVRYYFREPEQVYPRIDDAYIAARQFLGDMHPVRFLHMERLNAELYAFLVEVGYSAERVRFILDEGRIFPQGSSRSQERPWSEYYSAQLKARVRHRERLLFAIFPEYDR